MSTNKIILAGDYRKLQSLALKAGVTTLLPGMVVEADSAGTLQLHSTSGGVAERIVACEDALQGNDKTVLYVAGEVVDCGIMYPGSESQVMLVAGQNVAIGSKGMSNGAGKIIAHTGTNIALVVFTAALDLSDSGDVDTLVNARWI